MKRFPRGTHNEAPSTRRDMHAKHDAIGSPLLLRRCPLSAMVAAALLPQRQRPLLPCLAPACLLGMHVQLPRPILPPPCLLLPRRGALPVHRVLSRRRPRHGHVAAVVGGGHQRAVAGRVAGNLGRVDCVGGARGTVRVDAGNQRRQHVQVQSGLLCRPQNGREITQEHECAHCTDACYYLRGSTSSAVV